MICLYVDTFPTELGTIAESTACPEPNEYPSLDSENQGQENIAKRGDGTEPRAFTPIVGCDGIAPRLPVMVLRNRNPDVFNMLILALERVQNWPEDRELSWFQMTGIFLPFCHDLYVGYDGLNTG